MIKALIFDLDGVIILSEQVRFRILKALANTYDVQLTDKDFQLLKGKPAHAFLQQLLPQDPEKVESLLKEYTEQYTNTITEHVLPNNEIVTFIKHYQGELKFAVATMQTTPVLSIILKSLGISDIFMTTTTRDDVTKLKPDPEIYLKTAVDLSISPQECAVIEDSIVGVQSAVDAGMKCYIFLNDYYRKEEFRDLPVQGFIKTTQDLMTLFPSDNF